MDVAFSHPQVAVYGARHAFDSGDSVTSHVHDIIRGPHPPYATLVNRMPYLCDNQDMALLHPPRKN